MDGRHVRVGVEQEPGSGGMESAQNTARRLAGYRVTLDRPSGDKVARLEPFADQVNSGNVIMVAAQWNAAYIDELTFFPDSTYRDQADATSGAFNLLARKRRKAGAM
jgi:predicted phage terminase large subunit-like protein